jgi:phosphate uptake regulator
MTETALRALFANDYKLAETVLLEKDKVTDLESKFVERLLRDKLPPGDLSAMRLISESLRRIGEYATDVAEVVLNATVREILDDSEGVTSRSTALQAL